MYFLRKEKKGLDIGNLLLSFLMQLLFTIGILWLFGFLISLCSKAFYSNFGDWGFIACFVTGAVGTPVHELSHALFCLIFGHRIEEIKLFQFDEESGSLGYVLHSYNRKNPYHLIGCFFIGIAPILIITALLYLIAWPLVPDMFFGIISQVSSIDVHSGFYGVFASFWEIIKLIFSFAGNYRWWILMFIGVFLCLHMNLSLEDIKSALSGAGILVGLLFVADLVLAIIGKDTLAVFTNAVLSVGTYLAAFLILALIIALVAVIFSLIIRLVFRK